MTHTSTKTSYDHMLQIPYRTREVAFMPRIIVNDYYCKGCGLCVDACPTDVVALDQDRITEKGYHPAILIDESKCTGCMNCAVMCPDIAITVER